jgi:hypothetical protein
VRPNIMQITLFTQFAALVLASSVLPGCSKKEAVPAPPSISTVTSKNNRLKFKGGERLVADLATGLSLEPSELCKELGLYDCKTAANISLGGVEPYVQTIYSPVGERTASTANAVERIALSACHLRMERDFAPAAQAALFAELAAPAPDLAKVEAVSKRLYQKLLNRDASLEEVSHLTAFWKELSAEKEPAKAFATYACFAIATTEEALFF